MLKNFIILLFLFFSNLYSSEPLKKIKLQLQWKHQFEFAGFYAAKYKGYYKDIGIDVEFIEHKDGINQIEDVLRGKTDFAVWGGGVISSAIKGEEIVFLANYFKRSPLILVTQSDIRLPSELLNKKIMISQMDLKDAGLLNMFKKFNIDTNFDIKRVSPSYDINDFISKKVDAYLAFLTNELYFLEKNAASYNILDPNNYGVEQYDMNLFTSKQYAKQNLQEIRLFIDASNKGWQYALENKDEIAELILKEYNTQNKSKEALIFEANEIEKIMLPKIYPIGSIDSNRVRKIVELLIQTKSDLKDYNFDINEFIFQNSFTNQLNLTKEELSFIKNNKIKCVTNIWEPFNLFDDNKQLSGIAIDYWKLIAKKAGIDYQCNFIENWTDVLTSIKKDNADITLSTTKTIDRLKYSDFTKPYASFPISIATRNDFGYISDLKILQNLRVAVGKNTSAQKLLAQNYPKINFVETNNIDESLELLSIGKVDAVGEILPVLAYKMNQYGYSNLKIAGTSSFNFDVMMMVNDDKKILTSIIDKTIDTITEEEKQNIYNKWISVKYEQGLDYSLLIKIVFVFSVIILLIAYRHKVVLNHRKQLDLKNKELELSKIELNESNERLSIAAKASFDLLYEWDVKNKYLKWYGDIDKFLGYKNGEISLNREKFLKLIHGDDIYKLENFLIEHETFTEQIQYEYRIMQQNGEYKYWKDYALPIIDKDNKPIKWIGVCTDLTTQKMREIQLFQQSKLASMGEMIGNIAHQWRQPLSIISTIATSYKAKKELNFEIDLNNLLEDMSKINTNVQYLSNTIDDFRNFISGNRKLTQFNLKDETEKFLHLVESSIKNHNINIITQAEENIVINGYPNELIQCYMNLFSNSKDAFKINSVEHKYIFIKEYIEKEFAIIEFKDNAGGIDEKILSKIFEPYFTTKHKFKGTGIGLTMTYNLIVNGMNGKIEVENDKFEVNGKEYKGIEFKILVPLKLNESGNLIEV